MMTPISLKGFVFLHESSNGEVTPVKVLTDSGAGISCVSGTWVQSMKFPVFKGPPVRITGVTSGQIITDSYVDLTVHPPLRPHISVQMTLLVILDADP
jgi:hypothetical protein